MKNLLPLWFTDTLRGVLLIATLLSPFVLIIGGFVIFGIWFAALLAAIAVLVFAWACGRDFREFEEKERGKK